MSEPDTPGRFEVFEEFLRRNFLIVNDVSAESWDRPVLHIQTSDEPRELFGIFSGFKYTSVGDLPNLLKDPFIIRCFEPGVEGVLLRTIEAIHNSGFSAEYKRAYSLSA